MAAISAGSSRSTISPRWSSRKSRADAARQGREPHEDPPRLSAMDIDADLNAMTRDRLIEEVRRLRAGVRKHRDTSLHALCWHHPDLWGLLPEKTDPQPEVPDWPQFMRGCTRYRQSL